MSATSCRLIVLAVFVIGIKDKFFCLKMLEKAHGMRYNSKAASHILRCDGIGRRSGLKIHAWRLAYRFESGHRHHVAADVISFAATFLSKSHFSRILSQLLSESNPLRWLRFGFLFETQNVYYPAPTFFSKSERAHAAAPPSQTEPAALGFAWVIPDGKRKFCIDKYVKIPHIPRIWGTFCSYGMAQTESGIRTAGDRLTPPLPKRSIISCVSEMGEPPSGSALRSNQVPSPSSSSCRVTVSSFVSRSQ